MNQFTRFLIQQICEVEFGLAVRRHILATRNSSLEEVAKTVESLPMSEWVDTNGWIWAMGSVWSVNRQSILEAAADLPGPVLLTTTEDACRWYIYLRKAGVEPFSTVHEFSGMERPKEDEGREDDLDELYSEPENSESFQMEEIGEYPPVPKSTLSPLDFEDDFFMEYVEDEEDEGDEDFYAASDVEMIVEEFLELGMPLPDSITSALKRAENVIECFQQTHASYIADALERFDIPHERATVMDILTGESVTQAEFESDTGNLWRFLEHLGLGEQFANALKDTIAPEPEDEEPEAVYGFVQTVIDEVGDLPLHPIQNGPAIVPLADAPLLFRISNCIDLWADGVFTFQFDGDAPDWPVEELPDYVCDAPYPPGRSIGFYNKDTLLSSKARTRVGGTLSSLPDGTVMELLLKGSMSTARIHGAVQSGNWLIDSASSEMSGKDVYDMMALFERAEAKLPQLAKSPEEAEAILKAAKRHMMLFDSHPQMNNLELTPFNRSTAEALCALFFHRRFDHCWDMKPILETTEEKYVEWTSIQWEDPIPATDTIIYEGTASRYFEPDYDAVSIDEQMKANIGKCEKTDLQLKQMGYDVLGDLVCEKVGACILRCYTNESEKAYAIYYVAPFGQLWFDFFSRSKDGTTITTTNGMNEGSFRDLRIVVHEHYSASLSQLHADHLEGIKRLRKYNIQTSSVVPTLQGIASTMDDFLLKRLGTE
jgi:hypothetical protein